MYVFSCLTVLIHLDPFPSYNEYCRFTFQAIVTVCWELETKTIAKSGSETVQKVSDANEKYLSVVTINFTLQYRRIHSREVRSSISRPTTSMILRSTPTKSKNNLLRRNSTICLRSSTSENRDHRLVCEFISSFLLVVYPPQ